MCSTGSTCFGVCLGRWCQKSTFRTRISTFSVKVGFIKSFPLYLRKPATLFEAWLNGRHHWIVSHFCLLPNMDWASWELSLNLGEIFQGRWYWVLERRLTKHCVKSRKCVCASLLLYIRLSCPRFYFVHILRMLARHYYLLLHIFVFKLNKRDLNYWNGSGNVG